MLEMPRTPTGPTDDDDGGAVRVDVTSSNVAAVSPTSSTTTTTTTTTKRRKTGEEDAEQQGDDDEQVVMVNSSRNSGLRKNWSGSLVQNEEIRAKRKVRCIAMSCCCIVLVITVIVLSSIVLARSSKSGKSTVLNENESSQCSGKGKFVAIQDIVFDTNDDKLRTIPAEMEGLQGLTIDGVGSSLFAFHTRGVRVFDYSSSTGIKRLRLEKTYNLAKDFGLISNFDVDHIGGVDFVETDSHGNEIWVATHSAGVEGEGALFGLDVKTLLPKNGRKLVESFNLDWVAFRDGIIYYGVFFNVTKIYRIDATSLNRLEPISIELVDSSFLPINFVQSAAFDSDGNLVLLSDDYQTTLTKIEISSGSVTHQYRLLGGPETDGITFSGPNQALVGFNRQHSHEQTTGYPSFVSIVHYSMEL